jgi:hypothetical protein
VTLPLEEALEGGLVTLAEAINDKRRLAPLLADLRISLQEARLEYHPFLRNRNELLHARLRLALDATALAYGHRL